MRVGMLQATGDMEGRRGVFTFVERGNAPPEPFFVPSPFMAHFEALDDTRLYTVEVKDHEGLLQECTLLDAELICSHCDAAYTELHPFETLLSGHYCSEECVSNAEAFEDAMGQDTSSP
jgi:hypothetical protein